jgi:hypothetical protein
MCMYILMDLTSKLKDGETIFLTRRMVRIVVVQFKY